MKIKSLIIPLLFTAPLMINAENIFFEEFKTTHNVVPFDRLDKSYYEEAMDSGIRLAQQEIDAIANQRSKPTFDNTIVALDNAGEMLNRVLNTFFPLLSADGDDEMNEIAMRISPKLSQHSNNITLNEHLWEKVKYVYDNRAAEHLCTEDSMLLQEVYDMFVSSGANLKGADRDKYRSLSAELSQLSLQFEQNTVKARAGYEMWLTKDDLDGLPESAVEAAALAAKEKGREGEYLFSLQQTVYSNFMRYSSRRDLREKYYRDFNSPCINDEFDNTKIMARIAEIRLEIARLMGFNTYAEYTLQHRMAQNTENVYRLLDQLRDAYMPAWKREKRELEDYARKLEGKKVDLQAWDYSYYANKLKNEKYSYSEEDLRPYFELNNVINGAFSLANRLYGLKFTENQNYSVYNPEVKSFDVTDEEGNFVGVLYTDFFPRATKRAGAWMTDFRGQWIDNNGVNHRPHVTLTMSFTPPTETKPSLLTFDEVNTFFHEFGHGLHGLLSQVHRKGLSGTNVYRDFVEVPSQFNENFLTEKEFLDSFAKHYITGETIPQELVDKVVRSSQFGAAYSCLRQLSFGYLDMAYHTITSAPGDAFEFEHKAMDSVATFPAVEGCLTSPRFTHIFSGGYAAGYYSYKWAEVIEADAFAYFKHFGIFNKDIAKSWKDNVLSRGGTEPPMTLYTRFRGSEPTIDALLIRDGIKVIRRIGK